LRIRQRTSSRERSDHVCPFITASSSLTVCFEGRALDAAAAFCAANFENKLEAVMPVAQKAVIATASPRAFIVRHVALFAAAALFVFVLSMTYGLDLSPGFF
jgi:hypothetical protein